MNQNLTKIVLLILLSIFLYNCSEKKEKISDVKLTSYVDPFIGTAEHGHTFPGAVVPFGMVQLSPDNGESDWDWCSGYNYSHDEIVGFSHTHLSGTGIGDMCDLLFMPVNYSKDSWKEGDAIFSKFSHKDEYAEPGYYSVILKDFDIKVELTASERVGFHKYTFTEKGKRGVILDLGYALNWDKATDTYIETVNDTLVTGYRMSKGWAENQKIYFAAVFSEAFNDYEIRTNDIKDLENKKAYKAFFDFSTCLSKKILMKVGISVVSIKGAMSNLDAEIKNWDFEGIKKIASDKWEKELQKTKVETSNNDLKKIFYTAVYHSYIAPSLFCDKDSQYSGSDGGNHSTTNFKNYSTLSLWDTFRASHPLFTITQPERSNDMVKSMMAFYRENGLLPKWVLAGNETNTMIGYHAVPVIADAILKGITDIDAHEALEAMKKSANQDKDGIDYFREIGFIPADKVNESVSKALEYAFDDWCIAQVAKALNKTNDFETFSKRAESYKKHFDPTTGFMRGKLENKEWITPFDPLYSKHRDDEYCEGNAWQYSWFVPHNVPDLIDLMGGEKKFVKKLDSLFLINEKVKGENSSPDISGLIGQYAHGNEPCHHIAYLYNYTDEPWKTQKRIKQILNEMYTSQPDGLCGNDDCGQMSAWYVFSAMGFYPLNPVGGEYALGYPMFDKVSINTGNGKVFTILSKKADEIDQSIKMKNIYVKSVTLNGKTLTRHFIKHEDIVNGGTLIFHIGDMSTN